jgi:hypothetical protein
MKAALACELSLQSELPIEQVIDPDRRQLDVTIVARERITSEHG